MVWKIIFVVSLFFGSHHSYVTVPQSPCPWFFEYYYEGDVIRGHLQIPPPPDHAEIAIELNMLVNTHLTTKYYGRVDLLEDVNEAVARLQRGDVKLLHLRVHFPVRNPLPLLISLKVNGRNICTQSPGKVIGPYTMLDLNYKLKMSVTIFPYPSVLPIHPPLISTGPAELVRPQPLVPRLSTSVAWTSPAPQTEPTTTTSSVPLTTEKGINPPFFGCGIQHKKDNVLHGFGAFKLDSLNTQRSEWPWLVAIFQALPVLKFACAGTLISSKHVVTAKSCLLEKTVLPRNLSVHVGKFNLFSSEELYSHAQEVADVYLHGGKTNNDHRFVDLAIITFKSPVNLDRYIRPICLHRVGVTTIDSMIVGWGATNFNTAKDNERLVPKKVKMIYRMRDMKKCQNYNPKMSDDDAICAKQKSSGGTGVCKEDRGGGLYGKDSEGRWFLQGVVSSSDWESSSCINASASVLITNTMTTTAKLWFRDILSK